MNHRAAAFGIDLDRALVDVEATLRGIGRKPLRIDRRKRLSVRLRIELGSAEVLPRLAHIVREDSSFDFSYGGGAER